MDAESVQFSWHEHRGIQFVYLCRLCSYCSPNCLTGFQHGYVSVSSILEMDVNWPVFAKSKEDALSFNLTLDVRYDCIPSWPHSEASSQLNCPRWKFIPGQLQLLKRILYSYSGLRQPLRMCHCSLCGLHHSYLLPLLIGFRQFSLTEDVPVEFEQQIVLH